MEVKCKGNTQINMEETKKHYRVIKLLPTLKASQSYRKIGPDVALKSKINCIVNW